MVVLLVMVVVAASLPLARGGCTSADDELERANVARAAFVVAFDRWKEDPSPAQVATLRQAARRAGVTDAALADLMEAHLDGRPTPPPWGGGTTGRP